MYRLMWKQCTPSIFNRPQTKEEVLNSTFFWENRFRRYMFLKAVAHLIFIEIDFEVF